MERAEVVASRFRGVVEEAVECHRRRAQKLRRQRARVGRESELAVAARKFGNLMVFGCWWFVNNPSLIEEITRMRIELLGTSFIPQHSDARILDQLIYKWDHSRRIIGKVLVDKYNDLMLTGWKLTKSQVERDVRLMLHDNFGEFVGGGS